MRLGAQEWVPPSMNAVKCRGGQAPRLHRLDRPSQTGPGRAVAGECRSPRPSHGRSAGRDTRTLGASVGVGGSTPPDNSRRTTPKTWMVRGVAFPTRLSQRWIGVFNPSLWVAGCPHRTIRGLVTLSTALTLGGSGSRRLRRLLITELFDFRTTPRVRAVERVTTPRIVLCGQSATHKDGLKTSIQR